MFFRQILHEEKSCLSYIVGCPSKGVCATVDAQGDPQSYINIAEKHGLKITAVIETHVQADHLSASTSLADKTGATLYFGPGAKVKYAHRELADKAALEIGNRTFKAIHTPGHTAEHICLTVDDWLILTGDTLFVGDVGRVDLVGSKSSAELVKARASTLYESIQKLLEYPDWTEIYPGHYAGSSCGKGMDSKPSSTIGRERRKNPVLKRDKQAFVQYLLENMPAPPAKFREIKAKNAGE